MANPECKRLSMHLLRALQVKIADSDQQEIIALDAQHQALEIEKYIEQLRTARPDWQAGKCQAINWLAANALNSEAAVDALIVSLNDNDSVVQEEAARALENFGARARKALPALRLVAAHAARPLSAKDFEEQAKLLGGLTESAWERINRGTQVKLRLAEAANNAIRVIEKA